MLSRIKLNHCPTLEEINLHKQIAESLIENLSPLISDFKEGDENIQIKESYFYDTWVFSLVMAALAERCKGTCVNVRYGRSDGKNDASIILVRNEVQ